MKFETASGVITINKQTHYAKWLQGWTDGFGFTGATTLDAAWHRALDIKPSGCSWYALGLLMASEQRYGRAMECEEMLEALHSEED